MSDKFINLSKLLSESSSLSDIDHVLGYLKEDCIDKNITRNEAKILFREIIMQKKKYDIINEVVVYNYNGDDIIIVAPTENNRNFGGNNSISYFKVFSTKLAKGKTIDYMHGPCWRISINEPIYIHHNPEYNRVMNVKERDHLIEILNLPFYNYIYDEDYEAIIKTYRRAMRKFYRENLIFKEVNLQEIKLWNALIYKINRANNFSNIINILTPQPNYKDLK